VEIVSYQDFGPVFIDEMVTRARIEHAVAEVAGDRVEVGPIGVGPADAASVVAKGTIGAPTAQPLDPEADGTRRFKVDIPVELHLSVKVAGTLHRFESNVAVPLRLAVRTAAGPLSLIIDIPSPELDDLDVEVHASGVAARVLGRLGNVEAKIRKEVVAFISERLDSPEAMQARVIDIGTVAEAMWKS
jgi:hypothetical protein